MTTFTHVHDTISNLKCSHIGDRDEPIRLFLANFCSLFVQASWFSFGWSPGGKRHGQRSPLIASPSISANVLVIGHPIKASRGGRSDAEISQHDAWQADEKWHWWPVIIDDIEISVSANRYWKEGGIIDDPVLMMTASVALILIVMTYSIGKLSNIDGKY